MIESVLGNKTNILVLRFLIKFKNQFFAADEISKELGVGLRNTYDSLNMLSYGGILSKRFSQGKIYYKFLVGSSIQEFISLLFEEEHKRISLQNTSYYKIISEIESKIIKIAGSDLVDIILYGSVAKGRDTLASDIDICVLLNKGNEKIKREIANLAFETKYKKEIQIHVFTSKEFISADKNPLVKEIIRDGMSLKVGK